MFGLENKSKKPLNIHWTTLQSDGDGDDVE